MNELFGEEGAFSRSRVACYLNELFGEEGAFSRSRVACTGDTPPST